MQKAYVFIVMFLVTLKTLTACAEINYEEQNFLQENGYNFLDPSFINLKEDDPLYKVSISKVYASYNRTAYFYKKEKAINVAEWQKYLNYKVSKKELEILFYSSKSSLMQRYKRLSSKINNPSFERYLRFVEEQEESALNGWTWENLPPRIKVLMKKGEKNIQCEKDSFLKLRYLFLTMRLHHYSGYYTKTLSIYKQHANALKKVNSVVFEWIDALRAGALQHLGKSLESNLLYGTIFKNNKSNPNIGYYDFKIKNNQEWQRLLFHSKTANEKALFYFLRSMKWEASPLLEHRKIAKIAPNSIWFERLSYMIMQEFQTLRYTDDSKINVNNKYERANYQTFIQKRDYLIETLSLIRKPKFMTLYAKLYLEINYKIKDQNFHTDFQRLTLLANSKERPYLKLLQYMDRVRNIKTSTRGANKALFQKLLHLEKELPSSISKYLFNYTASFMHQIYPPNSTESLFSKQCSWANGRCFMGGLDRLGGKKFEQYIEKKQRSIFEKELFKRQMKNLHKNDIAKFLTILYTKEGNIKKANHYLQQVPKMNIKTKFNPFNVSFSGNNRKIKGKGYDQRKFIATMLKIEASLKKNPHSAMDHFLYANGLYNSTWFGNFHQVGVLDKSVYGFSKQEGELILKLFKKIEKEYKLAEKYAKKSEFKAKIAYQLLKIEFNRYLILNNDFRFKDRTWSWEVQNKEIAKLSQYYPLKKALESYKDKYKSTHYGDNIIEKCATFRYFR